MGLFAKDKPVTVPEQILEIAGRYEITKEQLEEAAGIESIFDYYQLPQETQGRILVALNKLIEG